MKRLPFLSFAAVASLGAITAVVACGGISDPTKGSGERVATVSGALTGMTVPANTRVALVWKAGGAGGYAVGSDVAVVNGKFTMDLSTPPSSYFFAAESDYDGLSGGDTAPPVPDTTEPAAPDTSGGSTSSSSGTSGSSTSSTSGGGSSSGGSTSGGGQSFAFSNQLSPRDTVSGQINQPLSMAVAGFVVYVDTNGNGKLDIEGPHATPTDDVIGGNRELLLAYLRDGGALDYEKLRDRSGILPQAGYNLAWDEGRWLPLNVVELKLSAKTRLPGAVCSGSSGPDETPSAPPSSSSSGGPGDTGYPDPNDPNLICSPDGRSWSYTAPCTPPAPSPPPPEGLCGPSYSGLEPSPGCDNIGYGSAIPDGEPAPDGWPCPVINAGADAGIGDIDAGPAPGGDAGAGQ